MLPVPASRADRHRFGSEAGLDAQKALAERGHRRARGLDALPNVFDRQDQDYRESVLPRGIPRVAVEAGVTRTAGSSTSAWKAPSSASTASASRPRPASYSSFRVHRGQCRCHGQSSHLIS
jgi:transketolase